MAKDASQDRWKPEGRGAKSHRAFDLVAAFHWGHRPSDPPPVYCKGIDPDSLAYQVMKTALTGNAARIEKMLAEPGALPDFASDCGFTPLMAAVMLRKNDIVEVLASHPLVNLGRQTADGWTALHYAAYANNAEAVRILLAHHAPFNVKTGDGETPFNLAREDEAAKAFLDNPSVARWMKRPVPETPATQPAPLPAPAPAAAEKKASAPDPLKDAFFRAITGIGLQSKDARLAMIDKCAAMDEKTLKEAYASIRGAGGAFSWENVFITAAFNGNTGAMRFLHDQILFDERTLNQALAAAVAGGGRRSAAHHLMAWGANPSAPYEIGGQLREQSIFDAAFRLNCFSTLEEMMAWRGDALKDRDAEKYQSNPRAAFALFVRRKVKEFRKLRGKKLGEAFQAAVAKSKIAATMAGYIEAHRDRFLRGNVEIPKETGGGAIAVALLNERYDFARLLIADGYRLADAPRFLKEQLSQRGSPEALKFADNHYAGKLENISVRDVGQKKRSEIRVLMSVPYRPHYGMY